MDEQPTMQPTSAPMDHAQNQMLMSILAYVGILVIVPFLVARQNPSVKFHIKQGLVLVVIELAVWILGMFLWQLWPLLQLINLATLVLAIIGIINASQNKQKELPLVGSYAKHFSI